METSQIIEKIEALRAELPAIHQEALSTGNYKLGYDKIGRWVERGGKIVGSLVSPAEAEKLKDAQPRSFSMGNPLGNLSNEIESYDSHLVALLEEIKKNPEFVISTKNQVEENTVSVPSALARIEKLCNSFHRFANQLRHRYSDRPTLEIEDEYDVQDLIHALLRLEFDDIRAEEWTPSYAGGSSRTDFLLKQEKVVIEIKKTRKGLNDKELGVQLITDIEKYQAHPDCKSLMCFVYDPEGRIGNPQGIIKDLEGRSNGKSINLKIIIEPQA
jgi:hypothetical protein